MADTTPKIHTPATTRPASNPPTSTAGKGGGSETDAPKESGTPSSSTGSSSAPSPWADLALSLMRDQLGTLASGLRLTDDEIKWVEQQLAAV